MWKKSLYEILIDIFVLSAACIAGLTTNILLYAIEVSLGIAPLWIGNCLFAAGLGFFTFYKLKERLK